MIEHTGDESQNTTRATVAAALCGAYIAAYLAFGRPLLLVFAVPVPLMVTGWLWGFRGAVFMSAFLLPLVGGSYYLGHGAPEDPLYMAVGLTLAMGLWLLVGAWSDHREARRARVAGEDASR